MFQPTSFPRQGQPVDTQQELREWVDKMSAYMDPDQVHWCDGSEEENQKILDLLVEKGTFIRLNPEK